MTKYLLLDTPVSDSLVLLNAIISIIIVVRLALFKRDGAQHRRWGGWVAYILIVAYGYFPIQLAFGAIVVVEPAQIVVNLVVCAALLRLKGNVMQLFKSTGLIQR